MDDERTEVTRTEDDLAIPNEASNLSIEARPDSIDILPDSDVEPESVPEEKVKKEKKVKKHYLCKLVKKDYLEDHLKEYKKMVVDSQWVCRKCGRTANDLELLHEPVLLKKPEKEIPSV